MIGMANDKPIAAEYLRQRAKLFQGLLIALNVALLVAIILAVITSGISVLTNDAVLRIIILFGVFLGSLLLLRRGYFQTAVLVVVFLLLAFQSEGLIRNGLFANNSLFTTYLLMLTTGLLLGRRTLLLLIGYTILLIVFIGVRQAQAEVLILPENAATNRILSFSINIAVTAFLLDRFGISLQRALQQALSHEQELRREIRERILLQEITSALMEAITPQQVAETIVDKVREAIGSRISTVLMLSEDGKTLELQNRRGLAEDIYQQYRSIPMTANLPIVEAIRQKQPIWLEDVKRDVQQFPEYAAIVQRNNTQASALLPFVIHDRAIGGVTFSFDQPGALTPAVKAFITEMTRQVTLALDRARIYEAEQTARQATERARDRLEFLVEAGAALASSLDYEETLRTVGQLATAWLADWCSIQIIDKDDHLKQVTVAHENPEKVALVEELQRRYPTDSRQTGVLAQILKTGEKVFFPTVPDEMIRAAAKDEEHLELLMKLGLRSALVVPLKTARGVIGAITLAYGNESGRTFDQDDITLAQELAQRASLAIEKAELYQEVDEQRERLAVTLGSIGDAVISTDEEGNIVFMNKIAEELTRWSSSAATGKPLTEVFKIINETTRQPVESPVDKIKRLGVRIVGLANHTVLIARDGSEIPIDDSGAAIHDSSGAMIGIVLVFRDIRERKAAEADLQQHTREIAILEERQRLSRDLHDAVSQVLFASSIISDALPRMVNEPEKLLEHLEKIKRLNRGALAEMRGLLMELRSEALQDVKLQDLLQQLVDAKLGQTDLKIDLQIDGYYPLPSAVQIAFYRIAQEALNNIAKHADASQVVVSLDKAPGQAILAIRDNGCGFDRRQVRPASMGLSIMEERAKAVGAEFQISSTLGAGTEVRIEWSNNGASDETALGK